VEAKPFEQVMFEHSKRPRCVMCGAPDTLWMMGDECIHRKGMPEPLFNGLPVKDITPFVAVALHGTAMAKVLNEAGYPVKWVAGRDGEWIFRLNADKGENS
jgi:hypothetical protein